MELVSQSSREGPETPDSKNVPNFTTSEDRGREEMLDSKSNDDNLDYSRPNESSQSNMRF